MTPEEWQEIIENHASTLAKKFDSVVILVTKYESEDGQTRYQHATRGNYFARLGHTVHWLEQEKARMEKEVYDEGDKEDWQQ